VRQPSPHCVQWCAWCPVLLRGCRPVVVVFEAANFCSVKGRVMITRRFGCHMLRLVGKLLEHALGKQGGLWLASSYGCDPVISTNLRMFVVCLLCIDTHCVAKLAHGIAGTPGWATHTSSQSCWLRHMCKDVALITPHQSLILHNCTHSNTWVTPPVCWRILRTPGSVMMLPIMQMHANTVCSGMHVA
jgi:hypothetical protein